MKYDVLDVSLEKPSNVLVKFKILKRGNDCGIMIHCSGDYGLGSAGNDNGNYIASMTAAALHRWRVRFLVYDFSEMKYDMSDSLAGISDVVKKLRSPNYTVYILTSDLCQKGVASLICYARSIFSPTIISSLDEIK